MSSLIVFLSGCLHPVAVETKPLFCDVAEVRRFSQEEIDWRATNAAWNLRKDLAHNEFGRAECEW